MSRTVLTYPDLPPVMTQAAADTRYLRLTGGVLSGALGLDVAAPAGVHGNHIALQIGKTGIVVSDRGAQSVGSIFYGNNLYFDGTANWKTIINQAGGMWQFDQFGQVRFQQAAQTAPGTNVVLKERFLINTVGTLLPTPDSGQRAISGGTGPLIVGNDQARGTGGLRFAVADAGGHVLQIDQWGAASFSPSAGDRQGVTSHSYGMGLGNGSGIGAQWTNAAMSPGTRYVPQQGITGLHDAQYGTMQFWSHPAGYSPMFTWRNPTNGWAWMSMASNGGVSIMPEGGARPLLVGGDGRISSNTYMFLEGAVMVGSWVHDAVSLGWGDRRWTQVVAANGTIQASAYEMKHDFAPLDPAVCVEAVEETDWVSFIYNEPRYVEPEPQDDEDTTPGLRDARLEEARERYDQALVESAHYRKQKGYVLKSPTHRTHDLFGLADRENTSVASDLAVVACALQEVMRRLAAVEAR